MVFVLDTNIFMEDWYFNSPPYKALLDYVKKTGSVFVMPRVVLEELRGKFMLELEARLINYIKAERDINRQLNTTKDYVSPFNAQEETEKYIKYILKKLKITKKQISDYPYDALEILVNKAIYRVKPFSPKGEEFRDALLWECVIDTVLYTQFGDYVVFISNDSSAYGNLLHKGKEEELHPSLKEEMIKRLLDGRSLPEGVKDENDYYEKNFNYFRKVGDFISKYQSSVAPINKIWLKKQLAIDEVCKQLTSLANDDENFQRRVGRLLQRRRLGSYIGINTDNFRVTLQNYSLYTNSDATVTSFFDIAGHIDILYVPEGKMTYRPLSVEDSNPNFSIDSDEFLIDEIDVSVELGCSLDIDSVGNAKDLFVYSIQLIG
jgi:hypothetical protein